MVCQLDNCKNYNKSVFGEYSCNEKYIMKFYKGKFSKYRFITSCTPTRMSWSSYFLSKMAVDKLIYHYISNNNSMPKFASCSIADHLYENKTLHNKINFKLVSNCSPPISVVYFFLVLINTVQNKTILE